MIRISRAQKETLQQFSSQGWELVSYENEFCVIGSWKHPPFVLIIRPDGAVMKPAFARSKAHA